MHLAQQHSLVHMQGLEVYSTVLWHMKKEVEVSYLAQEAIAQDRRSPQAWAIMGNCFSLQKVYPTSLPCTFPSLLSLGACLPGLEGWDQALHPWPLLLSAKDLPHCAIRNVSHIA